jgi:hypothetical protein
MSSTTEATALLTFSQAGQLCPGHPHGSTVWRWARKGVVTRSSQRIRLAYVQAGRKFYTTAEAVAEFLKAWREADEAHFAQSASAAPTRRETISVVRQEHDAATDFLARLGLRSGNAGR